MEADASPPPAAPLFPQRKGAVPSGDRLWIAAALATSFLACLIVDFRYFPQQPVFPDESRFLESAKLLAATGQFRSSGDLAWEMPGTALFQSLFFHLSAQPLLIVRIAQAILLGAQALLCGFIASELFQNRRTATIAAAMTSFYPFLLYFQGLMLSEPLFNLLLVAAMAAQLLWYRRGLAIDWSFALCCLLYAAATYTKATLTVLPPLLLAATTLAAGAGLGRSIRVLALAGAVYVACLAPWWARNYAALGTFVPFTTSSASNLYLGNNPANTDAGADWSKDAEQATVDRISSLPDEVSRQRAYLASALSYMRAQPTTVIENMGRKLLRFWNIVPNAQDFRTSLFAVVSAVSFGPVLVLALFCAVRGYARRPAVVSFYLLFAYFTLLHTLTIASLRYRLPLDSFLIVLAAEPLRRIVNGIADVASRQRRQPS